MKAKEVPKSHARRFSLLSSPLANLVLAILPATRWFSLKRMLLNALGFEVGAGYRRHYTESGTLTLSACAGRPVLACEEGIIGWRTRRDGLGEVVRPREVSSVIAGVNSLLDRAPAAFAGGGRERCAAVVGTFSAAKDMLARAVTGRIRAGDDANCCGT